MKFKKLTSNETLKLTNKLNRVESKKKSNKTRIHKPGYLKSTEG